MSELTPEEIAAMWIFGTDYAESGLSAQDWWRRLAPTSRGRIVRDFVGQMRASLILQEAKS